MKIISAFITVVLALLLTSCASIRGESLSLPESKDNSYESEESKQEFSLSSIDTSSYDSVEDAEIVYVLTKTEGTRTSITYTNDKASLEEVPNTQIWLLSKNGEFLNEEPFEAFDCLVDQPEWWVIGINGGVLYPYFVNENTGEFREEEPWGPEPTEFFGYTVYKYYWNNHTPYYGVTAPDKSAFAEPIYYKVDIPFNDRILLFNGNSQIMTCGVCYIMSSEKEILSECFHNVKYTVFDDESYIGIAMCGEDPYEGKMQLLDADGNPMPDGYWFVDRDGHMLSERFDYISGISDSSEFITEKNDKITLSIDGKNTEFTAADILKKYYK